MTRGCTAGLMGHDWKERQLREQAVQCLW